jgi:hypothetical protein
MARRLSRTEMEAHAVDLAREMYAELYDWRAEHPEASLDEIAAQVTSRRRQLIGQWIAQLACQDGNGAVPEEMMCPECGQPMVYKGDVACTKIHLEGEIALKRAYYFCPECQQKVFPP